ncbi:Zinc finger, RING-type [Parasponia andersonii]|uniref:Zinc finger, RING-type n=1 Tax=Parasponia andersonii TaxID=3476 RepID=A0A2P5CI01_PARAD|nr:Zinc finger, RING-type [Parasponia andersonii]
MKSNQENGNIMSYVDTRMDSSAIIPGSFLPLYDQSPIRDAKTSMNNKADSGLTCYNIPAPPRKRQSDSVNELTQFSIPNQKTKLSGESPFLDRDIVFQIHQHQSEIDRFVSQYTEKVRLELEQQRNRQARMLVSAIQEGIVKKLREKDDEIQRMGKLNWVLSERVKTLCVENQLWKDLAQSNEATANSLRTNLEQALLAHVSEERHTAAGADGDEDENDARSCCGSSDFGREGENDNGVWENDNERGRENDAVAEVWDCGSDDVANGGGRRRLCRRCGVRESMVLLLPCRHLCLCTFCGSTLRTCPVCTSAMTASVHVNFS